MDPDASSALTVFLTTQLMALGIGMVRLIYSGLLSLAILSLLINLIVIIATYSLLSDRKAQVTRVDEDNLPKN
jgi:hypothetical protein